MQIVEQTEQRLVLRQRRLGMALVMSLFSVMSLFTLLNMLVQGVRRWGTFDGWRWISWIVWLGFLLLLLAVGIVAAITMWHGVTCAFDREQGTATVRKTNGFRAARQTLPIYSVSHLDIEQNLEVRVFGIFLVLRSGERIALVTIPPHDEETMRSHARTVKNFLLGR